MKDERRGNTAGAAKNGVKPASTVSGGKSTSFANSDAAASAKRGGNGVVSDSGSDMTNSRHEYKPKGGR
jgi:hypothetical protein